MNGIDEAQVEAESGSRNFNLNEDQAQAMAEIIAAYKQNGGAKPITKYLLTGYAGTGKTYLMQAVVTELQRLGASVVVSAPTHKAVQVLRGKMQEAGIDVEAMTIHSFLGLKPTATDTEKTALKRIGKSNSGSYNAVVIDESSMLGKDLQDFIDNDLAYHFVLYIGDLAQLPPVGEEKASCFALQGVDGQHSNLGRIVRQAEGNPVLAAATALREQQGREVDWSWTKPAVNGATGIFRAGDDADDWMQDAFTSEEFKANNDAFRYLCYTNERVREVNAKIRFWIYGRTETPFVAGERVLSRQPIMDDFNRLAFSTNEEAIVTSIQRSEYPIKFAKLAQDGARKEIPEWEYRLPVWAITLKRNAPPVPLNPYQMRNMDSEDIERSMEANDVECCIPIDPQELLGIDRRLVTEAKANSKRWYDRFQFKDTVADLRSVYAMTIHTSQGSTFDNVFLDVPDASKLERYNPLEMQKLLYVAVTRPRYALMIVGG